MKNVPRTLLILLVFVSTSFSQGVTIGSNNPPDSSAILDLQDSTKGFLPPRLTTAQRNAINNPATSLLVYNTTTNCLQIYMPQSGWRDVVCDCQSAPSSAFTFPDTASLNQSVIFTATTQGMIYSWTFQSGNPSTSSQQSDTVTWSATGFYTVSLSVTDNLGCSSTTTDSIYIDSCSTIVGNNTITFNYTGAVQTWTVPQGVCIIKIECWGAQGWSGSNLGGKGGYAVGYLTVSSGQQLSIYVGGQGTVAIGSYNPQGGGWNGGGDGQNNGNGNSVGGGGGASDVRIGGNALADRIIVAGGGGGSTNNSGAYGGDGGGLVGQDGGQTSNYHFGKGGTQSQGGDAGGGLGQGGNADGTMTPWNGGGGGGYYGGGVSKAHSGGGGGSSYIGGVTNGSTQAGIQSGNGKIVITY